MRIGQPWSKLLKLIKKKEQRLVSPNLLGIHFKWNGSAGHVVIREDIVWSTRKLVAMLGNEA